MRTLTISEVLKISYNTSKYNVNKYKIEYFEAKNREDCIVRIMKKWNKSKPLATRYFQVMNKEWNYHIKYDKVLNKLEKEVIPEEFVMVPNRLKMFKLQDLKDGNMKITRQLMRRYGFDEYEINWLHNNGGLE